MNRHETFHTYGLKPKLLFCLNISAPCSCYHLNPQAPVLSQTAQHLCLGCISCFPPSCAITVSLLTNAFSSSLSVLRSGSDEYLASSQSCLAIDDSNIHVRHELPHSSVLRGFAPSPCVPNPQPSHLLPASMPPRLLTHLFWLSKTLTPFTSSSYFQSCSEPLLISCCPPVLSFRTFM